MKNLPTLLTLTAALSLSIAVTACSDDGGSSEETETSTGDGDGDPAGDGDGDTAGDGDGDTAGDGDGDTAGDGDGDTPGDGDGDTPGDGDGDVPVECVEISVVEWMAGMGGLASAGDPLLGDEMVQDQFSLQFYVDPIEVATIDLAAGDEANYISCAHCFLMYEDATDMGVGKTYYQSEGTLDITEVSDGGIAGTTTGVTLIEVTIAQDFTSTPVENGACLTVADSEFDTIAP